MVPASGQPVAADTPRPSLPAQQGSAHFLVHYDPATASGDYVSAGLADFEEAYSHLVTGGGGTPNAGLRTPVSDGTRGGDGRTDVYLVRPASQSADWSGGMAAADGNRGSGLVDSGFLYMTPDLARPAFRFRAAHEFMHVLQYAYIYTGGLFSESTANWAADMALPDVEPGDSQFNVPFLPLDCSYGSWKDTACGNGYRQWLFFEWLAEKYGVGFIHRLWTLHATSYPYLATTPTIDRQILQAAIAAEGGTLAADYAQYARALWDPTRWMTSAVNTIHTKQGTPLTTPAGISRPAPDTGVRNVPVDHLATRYVRIAQDAPSGPGDQVTVTATPGGAAGPPVLLSATGPGRARTTLPMQALGDGSYRATVSLDAAQVGDVVLPLTNDTTTDGLPFTYRAQLIPGGPAQPPTNDERATPLRVQAQTTTVLDIAYAGGAGGTEAPDCPATRTSDRGVWFVVLVDRGSLTIDPTASDFDPAVAVYDISLSEPYLWACSPLGARGLVSGETFAREYLVYVGRAYTSPGAAHTLRLDVKGVPNAGPTDDTQVVTPRVRRLKISPARFTPAKRGGLVTTKVPDKGGAKLTFVLTADARVRLAVERLLPGRRVGAKCVAPSAKNRKNRTCTRTLAVGSAIRRDVPQGRVRLGLTGRRTPGRVLPPGSYRLLVTAFGSDGARSAPASHRFRIVR
jgi:hypothetical protein